MDKKVIAEKIGTNVRDIMNRKGISIVELSKKCNISTGTVSKIHNAKISITVTMLLALCQGLEVPAEEILSGVTDKQYKAQLKEKSSKSEKLYIGILSINNMRMACIKNSKGDIMGTAKLSGGLDLAETNPSVLQLIEHLIDNALIDTDSTSYDLKNSSVTVVLQSYEFEDTRNKFETFALKKFGKIKLLPDWQITFLAAFGDAPGISLVTDKGVSLSYWHDKKLKKIWGWKFPVYDIGGENWLGVETIRHTVEALEGFIPNTTLAESVLAKFEGKIEKILEHVFKTGRNPDVYCEFSEILVHQYLTGDEAAKKIISKGYELIERGIKKIDDTVGKKHKITINGSLAKIYRAFIPTERLIASPHDTRKVEILADLSKS